PPRRGVTARMSRSGRVLLLALGGLAAGGALFSAALQHRRTGPRADIRVITHGQEVDLASHLAPGKYTLFDFYAVWCPPCRELSPQLERLAERHPGALAIRKVDIVDWTMPVAAQHRIVELPYLMLYDRQGRKMAEGEQVFDELDRLFGAGTAGTERATASAPATGS
ncbi:MAG TPA: thioredoxin family protein, partial [Candidatus Polarisedimenticolia bacterium]|nr:thioredoxin family protein [Candidatus Polarisedimenticolia bacterium]